MCAFFRCHCCCCCCCSRHYTSHHVIDFGCLAYVCVCECIWSWYFSIYCHSTLHYHHNKWWQGTFTCIDAISPVCFFCTRLFELVHVDLTLCFSLSECVLFSFFLFLVLPLRRANGKFLSHWYVQSRNVK